MIQEIKLVFAHDDKPKYIPVSEAESERIKTVIDQQEDCNGFIETTTAFGQPVYINLASLCYIHFLDNPHERFAWNEDDIGPSKQRKDEDKDEILWFITIYVEKQVEPIEVLECNGHEWIALSIAMTTETPFAHITDEDGEDLAISTSRIMLLIGTETDRYSENQLEYLRKLI